MIKGKIIIPLTIDNILKYITPFDIFRHFMMLEGNTKWKINQITNSPFPPEDEHPSFLIGNSYGELSFIDFRLGLSGDCFKFVRELYSLSSLDDVLRKIDEEFGLGIASSKNIGEYKRIKSEYKQPEEIKEKHYSIIQCITRKFTNEELRWWGSYYQDISDLKRENVFSIQKIYLNRKLYPMKETEMRYGYLFGNTWKLYFPNSSKKRKWLSNVPLKTAYGLENLNKDHNALILDSKKDYMVCRKVYEYCAGVQNESLASFSTETVTHIKNNSIQAYWGGDSDNPGKSASYIITGEFGWKHINPPDNLLPETKDWAKMAKDLGLQSLTNHFVTKRLFG
jgi:hypothetical protein